MTIPSIRPFSEDDFHTIERIPGSSFGGLPFEAEARLHAQGTAFTGVIGDRVVFCAGIDEMWDGVGSVWLVLDPATKTMPGVFYGLRVLLESAQKSYYHRLQAVVRADWKEARRFAEWYGFKQEGEMVGYGPNKETYVLYARVR